MGGVDSYDWSILGGNPTPGDPDGTRAMAARLGDLADGVDQHNRLLRSVGADSASVWTGPAADAFRPHLDKLPGQLRKLTASYHDAADALNGYWPRLAAAQQQAVDAWHKAHTAQGQVQTAQSQVDQADRAATSAADTYNQAATAASAAPPDPTGATAAHLSSLQTAYQSAANQLSGAHAALAGANANLQAAHAQADSARSQAKAAARHAAAGLHSASKAGIHNPHHSLIGSIVDHVEGVAKDAFHFAEHHWQYAVPEVALAVDAGQWLSHNWVRVLKDTSAVLGGIATVAGFVALVPGVGEIALPVALVSALGATADDAILAGTGKGKWSTVAEDGVGDLGFGAGEGLGFLAKGMNGAEGLSMTIENLSTKQGALTDQIRPLEEAASRWDPIGNQQVIQVSGDGTAQVTNGSDMAAQFREAASGPRQQLADVNASLAAKNADLTALPGKGGASGLKYTLRTFNPGEDSGTLAKVTNFFNDPAGYSRGILNGNAAAGSDTTGIRQLVATEGKAMWNGAGRVPYRVALGVGLAGTGLGTYVDKGAWDEALSNK